MLRPNSSAGALGRRGRGRMYFALALVLVELVTGQRPLLGEDAAELFVASADPHHRPTMRNFGVEDVPDSLEAAILRAVSVEPKERYSDVREFWNDVRVAIGRAAMPSLPVITDSLPGLGAREPSSDGGKQQAPERARGGSTELSSSTPVPPAKDEPSSAPPSKALRWLVPAAVAVALVGGVFWFARSSSEGAKSRAGVAPSVSSLPSAVPRPGNPTTVSAGKTRDKGMWLDEFRFLELPSGRATSVVSAQTACAEAMMALCTEAQWQRACLGNPELGRRPSWTLAARAQGFVVRGGEGCSGRKIVPGVSASAARSGLCCDRQVGIQTVNANKTFLKATSGRLLTLEDRLNKRAATELNLAPLVRLNNKQLSSEALRDQFAKGFRQVPDQWGVFETCKVRYQRKEAAKKKVAGGFEGAAWFATCMVLRQRAGQFGVFSTEYVFGGSGKLLGIRDLATVRNWAAP